MSCDLTFFTESTHRCLLKDYKLLQKSDQVIISYKRSFCFGYPLYIENKTVHSVTLIFTVFSVTRTLISIFIYFRIIIIKYYNYDILIL